MIGQLIGRVLGSRFRHFEGAANRKLSQSQLAQLGDARRWSRRQWEDFWNDQRAMAIPNVAGSQLLSVVPNSFFDTPDWSQFANELKGIQEVVRWTLYSYKAYPAAGSVNLLFFDQSEGTATNGRLDTNMTAPGNLPGNEMMVVVGISIDPVPAQADVFVDNAVALVALKEWYNVLHNGWFECKISGKEYLVIAPLTQLPPGHGLGAQATAGAAAATTRNVGTVQSGSPDNRSRFNLDPPFGLLPTRPFEARLRWNALQAVTTAGRMGVNYDGWKVRAVL